MLNLGPVNQHALLQLIKSGERERLKQLLRDKLTECGWRDEVKQRCREYIQARGHDNVTAEELVRFIRPEGRAAVPDNVKAELLTRIKTFILALSSQS
ncbi:transcription factor e(y)2-domain-containing protein [Scenedesmus sp. NREL 46B-D3]|nr:transcription factor e(y)2-domain-containing protein [Scenedesmus sp. NREL 46B-D3]